MLEVQIPGKDGVETLKEIKKMGPITQVIMLTWHATVQSVVKGTIVGLDNYIMKPTDTENLVVMITTAGTGCNNSLADCGDAYHTS